MEYKEAQVREITADERMDAESFQEFLGLFFEAFQKTKIDKRTAGTDDRRGIEFRDYQNLKKATHRFSNRAWFDTAKKFFDRTDPMFKNYFGDRRKANKVTPEFVKATNEEMMNIFKRGNLEQIRALRPRLESFTDSFLRAQKKSIADEIYDPHYNENPLFFGSNQFISVFEHPEMERVINRDLSEYKYTYLNQAQQSAGNYQYMAYWIMELGNTPEPVSLSSTKFEKFTKYQYDTPQFTAFIEKVQKYLRSNDRSALKSIMQEMHEYPTLEDANNKAKQEIKKVFRGIGMHDEDDDNYVDEYAIRDEEKRRKYVATSTSFHSAQNFEYMKGHLDAGRNSDIGFMLTYEVGPESIILDTKIFGGIFNEDEVVIDTTKAKLADIQTSTKDEWEIANRHEQEYEEEDY